MKRLVDVDEEALAAARARLGTATIKETVNTALRLAAGNPEAEAKAALDVLGAARLQRRERAWR